MSRHPDSALLDELRAPLWLAFHDAGAANLGFSWLEGFAGEMRAALAGPAAVLWERSFPSRPVVATAMAAEGAAMLLSGTGWASSLEHDARRLAREKGIRSVAVIDHWVNYPERFVRDGDVVLPDEIWVADADAATLARNCFPGIAVRQWPNYYLERQVVEVQCFSPAPPRQPPEEILYVLEPIRQPWNADPTPGEFQALAYFLDRLPTLKVGPDVTVCLRPHPSDPPGKYDDWPLRYPGLHLKVSADESLARQIARADWVVGCQTYALVVALASGKTAMSSLPPWAPTCPLPQVNLLHLRVLTPLA